MGGYCFNTDGDPNRVWPHGTNRLTLTPGGLELLLTNFPYLELPYVSGKEISDKGKANQLAKGIVCAQALWFCVQAVGRVAESLPLSLLELNTFAHALCALFIYMLWWEKPLDIEEPSLIETRDNDAARKFCAFGYACCIRKEGGLRSGLFSEHWRARRIDKKKGREVDDRAVCDERSTLCFRDSAYEHQPKRFPAQSARIGRINFGKRFRLIDSRSGSSTLKSTRQHNDRSTPICLRGCDPIPETSFLVSPLCYLIEVDATLLSRIQCLYKLYSRWRRPDLFYQALDRHLLAHRLPNYTSNSSIQASRWSIGSTHWQFRGIHIVALTFSGIFYGGLHALSWGSNALRSSVEALLWKISCATIICTGPLVISACYFHGRYSMEDFSGQRARDYIRDVIDVHGIFLLTICSIPASMLYLFSRVFLIVEVFLSLGHADPAVYDTPRWTPYWPHIS